MRYNHFLFGCMFVLVVVLLGSCKKSKAKKLQQAKKVLKTIDISHFVGSWKSKEAFVQIKKVCLTVSKKGSFRLTLYPRRLSGLALTILGKLSIPKKTAAESNLSLYIQRIGLKDIGRCRKKVVFQSFLSARFGKEWLFLGKSHPFRVRLRKQANNKTLELCVLKTGNNPQKKGAWNYLPAYQRESYLPFAQKRPISGLGRPDTKTYPTKNCRILYPEE